MQMQQTIRENQSLTPSQTQKAIKILVVDDERPARMALEVPLRLSGYNVQSASCGRDAVELGQTSHFDVVLTDVYMPGMTGLEVMREFRRFAPQTRIIVMTAQGSMETALEAIEQGAFDFIAKPFNIDEVLALVTRATAQVEQKIQIAPLADDQFFSRSGLIGHSPQMVRAYKLAAYAARTGATVLIEGESGTGKELIARAIHNFSDRAARPFTAVNCSALTETLLESELFGYTRGSFTGATADRAGLFERTDGGTMLLDELSTTSASFQASLLRVLQEREVRRIGDAQARRVDVRVIGATNASLEQLVEQKRFRADLFYRLNVLTITLPPLRERGRDDLQLLVHHFLKKHGQRTGNAANTEKEKGDGRGLHELHESRPPFAITADAMELLARYTWKGNVRELENTIEHAVAVASNNIVTVADLPERVTASVSVNSISSVNDDGASPARARVSHSLIEDQPTLDELSRRYITLVLAESGGNKTRAAEILGINRRTLYRYLDPFNSADVADGADGADGKTDGVDADVDVDDAPEIAADFSTVAVAANSEDDRRAVS